MKKYITTDRHPVFKENIEFYISKGGSFDLSNFNFNGLKYKKEYFESIAQGNIELWLNKGYIKELQEPKWTDDDMMEWVERWHNVYADKFASFKKAFEDFKQSKQ